MAVWEFCVSVSSHEALQRGVLDLYYSRVNIEAPTHLEASELAILIAWSRPGAYVTDCVYLEE